MFRTQLDKIAVFSISLIVILLGGNVHAGNFGIGAHSGYGVIKYEEETDALGRDNESESTLNTILLGVSGEYSFVELNNFFAGLTTDWVFGLEDDERWDRDGNKFQTNDIKIFAQFYDARFGYKNSIDNLYYRIYISGGWDGFHFKRGSFVESGLQKSGTVTEDISLWRTGGGIGVGYKFGKWALDGRAAYAYYPKGTVENSNFSRITFDTNGTCLDVGVGLARSITDKIGFYIGGSYSSIKLDESDVKRTTDSDGNIVDVVFPNSRTQITAGVVNLTYAF